jgi:hypothetical protein
MNPKKQSPTPTVTAKCIGCGVTREIKAGEVPPGEQPMRKDCGMPMVAVKATGFTLIEMIGIIAVLAILAATVVQTIIQYQHRRDNAINPVPGGATTNWLSPRTEYKAPVFDITKHKPTGPDIDPATINPQNNGYIIDLDHDGIPDLVMLDDTGKVTWSKGRKEGGYYPAVLVLRIEGHSLMAYTVLVRPGDDQPSVLFWTSGDRKGYHARCIGLSDAGYPYFGSIEEGE